MAICISYREKSENKPLKIISQMNDSIKNVKTLRMNIYALERVGKQYLTANSEIKLNTIPRKLYFLNKIKKLEVLYSAGFYANKAVVKPHVFPYFTMTLDPLGNIMRKNQHYTINELGYEFIGKSIALTINKDKDVWNNFVYHGKHAKNGYNCHFLEYENKNYNYINYAVGPKETATSIAYKLCVNDYLLRNKNDLLNDFGYLKKGTVLRVPTLYCRKAVLYIDEKMLLPVSITLYDDMGLFENYEFSNIQINKKISEEEFTKDYKDYHF
jgi:outer membrane lipoprotein-sorting protein